MKKILLIVCAISALFISTQSFAKPPSFTYVGVEYVASGDFNVTDGLLSVDVDTDGFALNASVELGIFFLQASRLELESDEILGGTLEDSITTLAVGLTFELPQTQVYGLIRGRRDELSLQGGGFNEDEDFGLLGAEVGVRFNLTDRFELNANLGRPSADEGNSFGAGAQFFITDNLGITLDYRTIEAEDDGIEAEFDTTSIGVRFTF